MVHQAATLGFRHDSVYFSFSLCAFRVLLEITVVVQKSGSTDEA